MRRILLWTLGITVLIALVGLAATPAKLPEALAAQRQLVAENPTDAGALNDLANLEALSGDSAGAAASYARAVELAPGRADVRFNYGLLLEGRGELGDALEQFRKVVEAEPDNAWAHYEIGAIQEKRGRRAKAVDQYATAFRLDPDLAFADVNPHVIESELTAEAMLRGYASGMESPQVPRVYAEPGRISALLVPAPVTAGGEPEAVAGSTGAEPEARGGSGQVRAAGAGTPGGLVPPRVLTEEDLSSGPVNQATPGAGRTAGAGRRSGRAVQTYVAPGYPPQAPAAPSAQGRAGARVPRQTRGTELVPYQPVRPSSSRLEMRLEDPTST